jgi:hypothetical protein
VGDDLVRGRSDVALPVGSQAWLSVRPEAVRVELGGTGSADDNAIAATVTDAVYGGAAFRLQGCLPGDRRIIAQIPAGTTVQSGGSVRVSWAPERARGVTD